MRYFVALLDIEHREVPEEALRPYEVLPRRRGLDLAWHRFDHAAVLTAWDDLSGDPLIASEGGYVGVGTVRLDNRCQVERWAEPRSRSSTDLELVLRVVARHGTKYIPSMIGDFGFIVWHAPTLTSTAATDAFAVKKVFYTKLGDRAGFASRAEALVTEEGYDAQHLAELVAGCVPSPGLTPYKGVRQLPPGTLTVGRPNGTRPQTYWSPEGFETDRSWVVRHREAADTCRLLLGESVRLRSGPPGTTWAQLSGGLDSSSIVCLAQWMAKRGEAESLAGTVTFVDQLGTDSDERCYSEAVVSKWSVPNEQIVEVAPWFDEGAETPCTDQPRDSIATFPRERRLIEVVRRNNGRVLLTGFAGDELFTGTMYFFADWLAAGRVEPAIREMIRRAAIGRASVWQLAYRNALLPMLPGILRNRLLRRQSPVFSWLSPTAIAQYGLSERATLAATYAGWFGTKHHHALRTGITALIRLLDAGFLGDALDVRYPFLYRPLVEFALSLPAELTAQPQARKWVLRQAMDGIVPQSITSRIGKGSISNLLAWSLTAQRAQLLPLLSRPILADLGIIDGSKLRKYFDAAPSSASQEVDLSTAVQSTLVFEAWLQMRSGRWPQGAHLKAVQHS